MKLRSTDTDGYATLITVLLLTMSLMTIAATLTASNYATNNGIEEISAKEQSYFLAYTCLEMAQFNLSLNLDYDGNETIIVADQECKILGIDKVDDKGHKKKKGKNTIITTTANVHGNRTILQEKLNKILTPTSFTELP